MPLEEVYEKLELEYDEDIFKEIEKYNIDIVASRTNLKKDVVIWKRSAMHHD